MSKLRLMMVGLSVVASAGIINCSQIKGNQTTPGDGPALNSESGEETEAERAARLLQEKMAYQASIVVDLKEMSGMNFGTGPCSASEYQAIRNKQSNPEMLSPYDAITTKTLGVKTVIYGADNMVKDMNSAENKYCAVNLGAKTADYALDTLLLENSQATDIMSGEEINKHKEANFPKAEQIAKKLLPVMRTLVKSITISERAMAKEYKYGENQELRQAISEQINELNSLNATIRASYTCEEGTECNVRDKIFGQATAIAQGDVVKAEEAIEQAKVEGSNDPKIDAKNDLLKDIYKTMNLRIETAKNMVAAIERDNAAAAQAAAEKAAAEKAAKESADAAIDQHIENNQGPDPKTVAAERAAKESADAAIDQHIEDNQAPDPQQVAAEKAAQESADAAIDQHIEDNQAPEPVEPKPSIWNLFGLL